MSGSHRDLVKALTQIFSAHTVLLPLSEDLQHVIDLYLHKYPNIDEHESQRLHDDLLSIYHKYVAGNNDKHGAFLSALRYIRPAITGERRLGEWWDLVIRPTIDAIGHKRDVVEDAREFLLSILVYDVEDDRAGEQARVSARFTKRLLNTYLDRTRMHPLEDEIPSAEDEFIAHELESIIVAFGRKKPRASLYDLLLALDDLLLQKDHRLQALSLLCSFVRYQPPHLYVVVQTPLIEHLLKCLMIDTSSTIISLALTSLIMFLPHIPSAIVSNLPRLFLIYSRLLCWEKFVPNSAEAQKRLNEATEQLKNQHTDPLDLLVDPAWSKVPNSFDNSESTTPDLMHYFTFLYGLYPLNFMSYIRKPRKYLKNTNFPGADDFDLDQAMIRNRTEQFRQAHLLHPNFFNTTIEDELQDNRWLKSDAADVVAECMGLCIAVPAGLDEPGPPPQSKLPAIPKQLIPTEDIPEHPLLATEEDVTSPSTDMRSNNSWRNTQSTAVTSQLGDASVRDADSPTLPPLPTLPEARAGFVSLSRKSSRSLRNGSVSTHGPDGSPRLDAFPLPLTQPRRSHSPKSRLGPDHKAIVAALQRKVMLLQSDLNFERYLKQQQLSHIGQLQRKHLKEATAEAETQNLINTNRALKAKLAKANEAYATLKRENMTGRNQSKKWEGELSAKVRSFRDDQKEWTAEESRLRLDLEKAQKDCENLRKLLVESESKELLSQQKLRAMEIELEELDALKKEVDQLHHRIRDYELKELHFEQANEDLEIRRIEMETLDLKLKGKDAERERLRKAYERKVNELQEQIQELQDGSMRINPANQQMMDSAILQAQQRTNQTKKAYTKLLHKHTELELRYQELEANQLMDGGHRQLRGTIDSLGRNHEEPYARPFTRQGSTASGSVAGSTTGSNGAHSSRGYNQGYALNDNPLSEDDDILADLNEMNSPMSDYGHHSSSYPVNQRPTRYESLQHRSASTTGHIPLAGSGIGMDRPSMPPPPASSHGPSGVMGSGQSTFSVDTQSSSSSAKKKAKITTKSEVRVYGRGGAQNIKMKEKDKETKDKDKDKDKDKEGKKTGGFRSLRGIL